MSAQSQVLLNETAAAATVNSRSAAPLGSSIGVALDVTAVSGTPTLDVEIEWSGDGVNWVAAGTPQVLTQATTTTQQVVRFDCQAALFRVAATIGGTTPSFDFSVVVTHFS